MNEAETRAELIDPALKAAGWGVVEASRVRREVITLGRLQGAGLRAAQDIADYVLTYRNHKLAVIEAKRRDLPDTEGVGQVKKYAEKLQTRFAYSTNGVGIYQIDMTTGAEQYVEAYPTPDELWNWVFSEQNAWRDRFAAIPFEDKGGQWQARYYQDCQIASNCDPFFAPNRDPSGGLIELRGMAFTGVGRLWVSGLPERPFRVRRRQATYPQRTARTLLVRSQFRFLNRQLVLPVSTMSQ